MMNKKNYGYARVSGRKQSTDSQLPELKKWAEKNCPDAEILHDVGTGRNFKRPSIQRIMSEIKRGEVESITAVSINRFGRNTREMLDFLELAKEKGVAVRSLREGVDTSTPMGKMIATLLAAVAELENEQRQEATIMGIRAKREACERAGIPYKHGGSQVGHHYKIDRAKAETIIHLREKGFSYLKIGNAVGLSDNAVRNFLINPTTEPMTRRELAEVKNGRHEGQ